MDDKKLLQIYLQDHHAAAVAGCELAKRAASNNQDGELAATLARLVREVDEDRRTLEDIMSDLGCSSNAVKDGFMWVGEKLGRLKLNGRITGYSPLSRVLELEGLIVSVTSKRTLWEALRSSHRQRLERFDLDALIERADAQLAELKRHHAAAAQQALSSPSVH